jgi:Zn finger protein HypA/HybF involved in hydrogenase expression
MEKNNNDELFKQVHAMLNEALATARTRRAQRITALHLIMYDHSLEALHAVRQVLDQLCPNTMARDAGLIPTPAPGKFICWYCCGLRYEALDNVCPNCGSVGFVVPPDVIFSLDTVDTE